MGLNSSIALCCVTLLPPMIKSCVTNCLPSISLTSNFTGLSVSKANSSFKACLIVIDFPVSPIISILTFLGIF